MKKLNENGTSQGYLPYPKDFLCYGPDCRYCPVVHPFSRIKKVLIKQPVYRPSIFSSEIIERTHENGRLQKISIPYHKQLPHLTPPCLRNIQNALSPPPLPMPLEFHNGPPSCSDFSFFVKPFGITGRVCKYTCPIWLILHQKELLLNTGPLNVLLENCFCRPAVVFYYNNNNNNHNNFICIAVYTKALYRFTIKKENN